jgi:hypothetical protein
VKSCATVVLKRWAKGAIECAKGDSIKLDASTTPAVAKADFQVAFANAFCKSNLHIRKHISRGWGTGTKRASLFDQFGQFDSGGGGHKHSVKAQVGGTGQMGALFFQQLGQPRHGGVQLVFGHCQASGHLVATALYQQPFGGQPLDRRAQINARNRPPRSFAYAIFEPDYDRRTV